MADLVGQQLGNYRLVRSLGKGGYAEVYLGEHVRLNTQAAIKVLHTRLASSEEVESFQNEGRTIARLIHPHIIRVFDFDVVNDIPFMVMDYAPNGTLRKRYPRGQRLPMPTILSHVKQIASALQYAHDQQLVHRDVKPENMLLDRNNEVLLSDFGTALVAQSTGYQTSLQEVIGTVTYMAPEQFEGKSRPASDQYSLGVVVYEWLCGDVPFHGSGTEVAIQHTMKPPPPLHEKVPEISPQVEQVVMRALAKDHHQRFSRVQDFADALEQASQTGQSFYSDPTIAISSVSPFSAMPDVQPKVEAPILQAQPHPITYPPLKPSPLAMDTMTSEVAHVSAPGTPMAAQPSARTMASAYSQYVPVNPSPAYQQPLQQHRSRAGGIVLLLLALLLVVGGSIAWFVIPHNTGTSSPPGSNRPGQQSITYPNVAGAYNGTLINTTASITARMSLSIQQNNANISGDFTVGPPLVGSNPFTGKVDTAKHIQFTVKSYHGNAPLFFDGSVQADGSLAGTYCSLGADSSCNSAEGARGTWTVAKQSGLVPPQTTSISTDNSNNNNGHTRHKKKRH